MRRLFTAPTATEKPTVFPFLHLRETPVSRPLPANRAKNLFLSFFVDGLFFAPSAPLFELNLPFNFLLILAGPIVDPFALPTRKFYKSSL